MTSDELDEIRASITVYRFVDGHEVDRRPAFPMSVFRHTMLATATAAARSLGQMSSQIQAVGDLFNKVRTRP